VIDAVTPILVARGFRQTEHDARSLATSFERQLSEDVRQAVGLTFFDGPIAAKNIVWMTGAMALSSQQLLGEYERLTESQSRSYWPVSVSFDHHHQQNGAGGWKFEVPDLEANVASFRAFLDDRLEPLARFLDSAEKQVRLLVDGPYEHAYWNQAFFKPIALLMLGRKAEAAENVRETFSNAAEPFVAANRRFLQGVLRDAV
jgi:hypothetical protein